MPLPRDCTRCGNKFKPNSSTHKLCYDCIEKAKKRRVDNSRRNQKIFIGAKTQPNKCKFCNEKFRWKATLIRHLQKEHRKENKS